MNPNSPDHDPALQRVDALHRQQLSALIDGELSADQARFLIRRLEHDQELSACQERWQIAGDVLRGQLGAVAPADFAARVALALPPATSARPQPVTLAGRRRGWALGGAMAAALALLAVLLLPSTLAPGVPAATVAIEPADSVAPATPSVPAPAASVPLPATPALAPAAQPVQLAVATPPPRPARARAAPQPAVPLSPSRPAPVLVAQPATTATQSPFALPAVAPSAKPWPRSQLARPDAFNVGLPSSGSPFAPPQPLPETDHWPSAPRP